MAFISEFLFQILALWPLIFVVLPLAGISYAVYAYVWWPYTVLLDLRHQGIPTLQFRPYFGQLPEFKKALQFSASDSEPGEAETKFLYLFREWEEKYGSVSVHCFGPIPRVLISDPSLVREILFGKAEDWPKSMQQKRTLSILGNGLVNSNGSFWHRQRRMLNPSFGQRSIKEVMPVMVESTKKMISRWTEEVENSNGIKEIDVSLDISGLALNIIGQSAFGASIEGGSEQAQEIAESVAIYLENVIKRVLSGALFFPGYTWLPTKINQSIAQSKKKIQTLTFELIQRRRERTMESKSLGPQGEVENDLLSSMLVATDDETNKGMTNEQLVEESITILLAGHETTAQLVTWTMYLLARHPEWQERVRKEALNVIGPRQQEVEWEHLSSLTDLHLVLQESLRFFPPVPLISRSLERDMQLGPYRIPRGSMVAIPIGQIHHKKEIWGEDADEFRPERFADGIAKACKDSQMFIPFSSGPRNCIGQAFAVTEAKVIMAKILQNFSWRLSPGHKHSLQAVVTLRPTKGMPMILEKLGFSKS